MTSLRQLPLTQEAATTRLNQFATDHKLAYHLFLKFDRADTYQGRVTATFSLQKVSKDLFIDWSGSDITSISINGTDIKEPEELRKDRFIYFPEGNLKIGDNTVTIGFKNKFARNGQGLHGFIDTDGKQYFYSELEPYYCNKFFPTFDQPELKAPLYLTTAAPKEWIVVANNPVDEKAAVKVEDYLSAEEVSTHKIQVYTPTPRISSYLYCCCGGDYKVIKNNDPDCKIPQSIFCRESLLTLCEAQAKEIFLIHKESILFYENYFGVPYPFEKCDSLFAVEYNMGAMENPGLILYNDRYIWKDAVTKDQNTMRANVICHEVSHQWFGNLVTMKWWNDLWLNESFAEYISHYCQSKIQQKLRDQGVAHIDPWALIHLRKENGYIEDQQTTTHPIAGCVHDTDQAKSIFDGITYSKGAATIRQLMSFVGEENFGKALGEYFKKYSWSNTTLADFIGALQNYYKPTLENAPKDLDTWSKEWLETAGLNTADPCWDPKDTSTKAKLTVTQGVALADYPVLRHHKIKIAFFNDEAKIYDVKEVILNNTEKTVIEYDGSKQPRAILLNYADEAFIKVSVDLESLNFFKLNLQKIDEDLTRILIWRAFYDQARDGHWSIYQFTHFAGHTLHHEHSNVVAKFILQFSNVLVNLIPKVLRENFVLPELFHGVMKALEKTDKSDSARLVLLRDHVVLYASYGELKKVDNVARLMDWFTGVDAELSSHPLSLKNQWAIVEQVHCYPKASELTMKAFFDKVAEKDKSDEMTRNQKRCEAIKANKKQRTELWNQFLNSEDATSLHTLAEMMRGYRLNPRWNHDDEKAFFNNMITVYEKRDFFIGRSFVTELFPRGDNLEFYISALGEVAKTAQHAMLKKQIGQHQDNLKRKQKCYLAAAPDLLKLTFNINI